MVAQLCLINTSIGFHDIGVCFLLTMVITSPIAQLHTSIVETQLVFGVLDNRGV